MPHHFKFDETRTFGIEFECVVKAGNSRSMIENAIRAKGLAVVDIAGYEHTRDSHGRWVMKTDGSIQCNVAAGERGLEICSPILKGFEGLEQIKKVCEVLAQFCKVNKSCGMHVHHGASDFNDEEFKSLYRVGVADQWLMNRMLPPSRINNRFAQPLVPYAIRSGRGYTVPQEISARFGRYQSINFDSYIVRGTIEFRQHSGTVEYQKAMAWLVLTQAVMAWAKRNPGKAPKACTVKDDPHAFDIIYHRYGFRSNETFEGSVFRHLRKRMRKFAVAPEAEFESVELAAAQA